MRTHSCRRIRSSGYLYCCRLPNGCSRAVRTCKVERCKVPHNVPEEDGRDAGALHHPDAKRPVVRHIAWQHGDPRRL